VAGLIAKNFGPVVDCGSHCDQSSRCVGAGEKMKRNLCCENCWVAKQRLAY
jgi:hypothetical protein